MINKLNIIVTNECNAYTLPNAIGSPGICKFCFRPLDKIDTNREKIDKIIDKINENKDVKDLIFTGGDPLFSPNIGYILKLAHENGYYNYIHTNGLLLEEKQQQVMPYVNCISLPYDGDIQEVANYYRGEGYFNINSNCISLIKKQNKEIAFNTLVTKKNINRLNYMADKISELKPKYWFVKKYRPINWASKQTCNDEYELSNGIYEEKMKELYEKYPNINIFTSVLHGVMPPTMFLHLDGKIYFYKQGDEKNELLGNILEDGWDSIFNKFNKLRVTK